MVKGDFDDNNNYTNDDNELVLGDEDQFGGAEVIGESIPNKLLPNTGGVSPQPSSLPLWGPRSWSPPSRSGTQRRRWWCAGGPSGGTRRARKRRVRGAK